MIRQSINIKPILPMKRKTAADIATLASRYDCTFVFEAQNVILNAKSMLGLLSMTLPAEGEVVICTDGDSEQDAAAAMQHLLERLISEAE